MRRHGNSDVAGLGFAVCIDPMTSNASFTLTNARDAAGCDNGPVVVSEQLEFDGRTAGVQHENFHKEAGS